MQRRRDWTLLAVCFRVLVHKILSTGETKMKSLFKILLLLAAALLLVHSVAWGAARTWSGATSTNWNTTTNWLEGVVPGTADDVGQVTRL